MLAAVARVDLAALSKGASNGDLCFGGIQAQGYMLF